MAFDTLLLERRGRSLAEPRHLFCLHHGHLAHLGDVGAGDEGLLARAGHDQGSNFARAADVAKAAQDFAQGVWVEGVQRLRAIDGESADRVGGFEPGVGVGHGSLLGAAVSRTWGTERALHSLIVGGSDVGAERLRS